MWFRWTGRGCRGWRRAPGQRGRPVRLLANVSKIFRDLRVFAALFVADFGPAENSAKNVIEIVRNSTGQLPDGFEFLRLLKLTFQGADLRHVLHDPLKPLGSAGIENAADAQPHGDKSAVAAPPFCFRVVHYALLAAIGKKLGKGFGVAKNFIRQIQCPHFGKAGTGKNFQKGIVN